MTIKFAVLGDSIAYGQGATRPADTIGSRLVAELTAAGRPAELRVLAVPRSRSDALAGQVAQARRWGSTLALIIVGANDLTHFVPAPQAVAALVAAVRALRAAGNAVVVLPAPDLSVVPWVPEQFRTMVQGASAAFGSAQTQAAQSAGALVADLDHSVARAFARDPSLFSADQFHPSSAGYALIAAALTPAVLAATAAVEPHS